MDLSHHIMPEPNTGCWLWTGHLNGLEGYGGIWLDGKERRAHKVMWEDENGPVPEGLVLDHACRQPLCVNPQHLEPVTDAENIKRGRRAASEKTHCPQGHEYSVENTYVCKQGKRSCNICKAVSTKRYLKRMAFGEEWTQGKTHCKHGHTYTEENTYHSPTGRQCRTCKRARGRALYRKVRNIQ